MTKDEQLKHFKKSFRKYLRLYGLTGWKVKYRIKLTPFSRDEGWIDCDINTKEAIVKLYRHSRYCHKDIERVAFHEATHLLFADLLDEVEIALRGVRGLISKFRVRKKEHIIIDRLDNLLFERYGRCSLKSNTNAIT